MVPELLFGLSVVCVISDVAEALFQRSWLSMSRVSPGSRFSAVPNRCDTRGIKGRSRRLAGRNAAYISFSVTKEIASTYEMSEDCLVDDGDRANGLL